MKYLIALLILAIIALFIAYYVFGQQEIIELQKERIEYLENHTPTIRELQKQVGAIEDGIVGRETLEKWNWKICDQYAEPYFKE